MELIFLKSIQLESENTTTNDLLNEISSQKYLNDFKSNSNYNNAQIIADILLYLIILQMKINFDKSLSWK